VIDDTVLLLLASLACEEPRELPDDAAARQGCLSELPPTCNRSMAEARFEPTCCSRLSRFWNTQGVVWCVIWVSECLP
jgi:hypothetical protein